MNTAGPTLSLDRVTEALDAIRHGGAVVVVDDEGRENEGDLIFAAEHATPALVGFMVRYTSGMICVPMAAAALDRLKIPPMTQSNEDSRRTAYAVTVDARRGVSTGISATDRAYTIRMLASPTAGPDDFNRPGHVFPLRARPGGVLERLGHTEAAIDLACLAGCAPVGVLCELVHDDGEVMRAPALRAFADEHGLPMIAINDLVAHRIALDSGAPTDGLTP